MCALTISMAAGGAALAGGSLSEEELRVPLPFAVPLDGHRSGGIVEESEIERRRLLGAGEAKKKGKEKKHSSSPFLKKNLYNLRSSSFTTTEQREGFVR